MTGAFLGCAHEGIAAAVDGYISVAAALCAVRLCPAAGDYLFLSHQSYELGYAKAAQALGLTPCLALDMRLGEGSGCPLLFRVLEGACGVMANMEMCIRDRSTPLPTVTPSAPCTPPPTPSRSCTT